MCMRLQRHLCSHQSKSRHYVKLFLRWVHGRPSSSKKRRKTRNHQPLAGAFASPWRLHCLSNFDAKYEKRSLKMGLCVGNCQCPRQSFLVITQASRQYMTPGGHRASHWSRFSSQAHRMLLNVSLQQLLQSIRSGQPWMQSM